MLPGKLPRPEPFACPCTAIGAPPSPGPWVCSRPVETRHAPYPNGGGGPGPGGGSPAASSPRKIAFEVNPMYFGSDERALRRLAKKRTLYSHRPSFQSSESRIGARFLHPISVLGSIGFLSIGGFSEARAGKWAPRFLDFGEPWRARKSRSATGALGSRFEEITCWLYQISGIGAGRVRFTPACVSS